MSFRRVERRSSFRINILALESAATLTAYVLALRAFVSPAHTLRIGALAAFGAVYYARLNTMARWLLPRELALEEVTFVALVWIPGILASFVVGAAATSSNSKSHDLSPLQLWSIAAAYGAGSWLNTWSELQRKWFKARPVNKGRCFTGGLFAWSRNINYLGDVVLFGAWAAATSAWWNMWVPAVMFLSFKFYHIPDKERYLAQRYAREWPAYAAKTAALVPGVC